MPDHKLFAGAKIRRFRKGLGLTQAQMAAELEVSASYLNLMERDQRPVSARVLLRLADTFDLDLRGFGEDADARLMTSLTEAASDPLLMGFELSSADLKDFAEHQPQAAEAFVRLHAAYRDALADSTGLVERLSHAGAAVATGADASVEEVRDAFHARDNHYPELEDAAETLADVADAPRDAMFAVLSRRLRERHNIAVSLLPFDVMGGTVRRYDRHSRRLLLSELLRPSSRVFQLAVQIALLEADAQLDALVAAAPLSSEEARRIYRIGLANYFAAAVMTPYAAFFAAAEETRYDIELLARRFSVSFEQVSHRLTTLRRPGARGVPFFMLRVDQAGNVSKRFGGRVFPFARSGGACPRWGIYDAFRAPGRIHAELVELPDGARYLSIACAVRGPGAGAHDPGRLFVIALGCEVAHAGRVVYGDGLESEVAAANATPIGVNCRLCERATCRHRAHPPLQHRLYVDPHHRALSPFAIRTE